jgi:hypothetical protein
MTYELTVTPKTGEVEGFAYVLTMSRSDHNEPGAQTATFAQLADFEHALERAGFSALVDRAGKTLELGKQFSNTMEMSEEQVSILLGHH